jgi:hypothetical protein
MSKIAFPRPTASASSLLVGLGLCATAAMAPAAPALAQATQARELLLLCQARADQPDVDLAQCSAYLRGFLDRVLQEQVDGAKPTFCAPRARISAQTAATALTRLAFREPAALDEPAPVFLELALERAFPCETPTFNQPPATEVTPANPVSIQPQPLSPVPGQAAAAPQPVAQPAFVPNAPATSAPMQQTAAMPAGNLPAGNLPAGNLPSGTPQVGQPGTVGPVRNAPGGRVPTYDGRTVSTKEGMKVSLPPARPDVETGPIEVAPPSTSRPSLIKEGAANQTPAAIATRVPGQTFGPVPNQPQVYRNY